MSFLYPYCKHYHHYDKMFLFADNDGQDVTDLLKLIADEVGAFHKWTFFSSPEHKVLKVSFCDGPLSVAHRPCFRPCVRQHFFKTTFPQTPPIGFWPNFTGMIPGWTPTKIQMVLIGCISRSQGQKLGFQNAIFKNLVWNYKAQSFHILCITSSRGPLPIFGGQHQWSSVNGSNVTFDLFLRWATQGPFGPSCL